MGTKKATADYYVVRIYRREANNLNGLVETQSGARQAFHNLQELWRILSAVPPKKGNRGAVE